jgi:hypothetical protein
MILLPDIALTDDAGVGLAALQAKVDAVPAYADRVADGKRLFAQHNRRGNAVFDDVKRALDAMCAGARRCVYCEDSVADEVEHVRPMDLYPELVFVWPNYVYACGPCNGPKGSHFAVFVADSPMPIEVARKRHEPVVPPRAGDPALIDPRVQDATQLMTLDLRDTFHFTPSGEPGSRRHASAVYTIETLRLNRRDALVRARREAFRDYRAHLRQYQHERDLGASAAHLTDLRDGILRRQHPTVWREMQRQHTHHPAIQPLFAAVPDAVTW